MNEYRSFILHVIVIVLFVSPSKCTVVAPFFVQLDAVIIVVPVDASRIPRS